ncbi:GreA/GreB family elongation factor [Candidatus Saccharibacteria bacterium]|nr:GreA/GreB family elongation factor [Candidatus Saccharibacteria bacterium]
MTHVINTTITTTKQPEKTVLLSKKGMKELKKAISQLEYDRTAAIRGLHDIDKTTGHDDRLERIERLARLESIESELSEKRHTILEARLLPSKRARMKVALGSVVDLIDQQGRIFSYTIVDTIEANPSDGRISALSPLGSTLVGKTVKDIVHWGSGMHSSTFQLLRIS